MELNPLAQNKSSMTLVLELGFKPPYIPSSLAYLFDMVRIERFFMTIMGLGVENFLESIKLEKVLASISSHQGNEENKTSLSKKSIKKNKRIPRSYSRKKEKEPTNMAGMQRVIKKLTNDTIDLKKNKGEGNKPFKPFMKRRTNLLHHHI